MVKLVLIRIALIILGILLAWLLVNNYRMFDNVNKEYPDSEVTTVLAFNIIVFFLALVGCIVFLVISR